MARTIGIGIQEYAKIRENDYSYIDKTHFIKEWWESGDSVTLITRPRRFGKTLAMSMTEQFFSVDYAGRGDLFQGLSIWQEEKYRALQGTYPVISLSFANVKETDFKTTSYRIRQLLMKAYEKNAFLRESGKLSQAEKSYFERMAADMSQEDAPFALYQLSDFLYRHYGKKVIILLDEYDTPMQEAYVYGYWEKLVEFARSLFNSTLKTNPWLERAIMTGITRISKDSVFSDLNNLEVVTTTSDKYAACFGFTEQEVFTAMDEVGRTQKQLVKEWYDGFTFGEISDIYNPWSILNFLEKGKFAAYWANTSENSLVGRLIREGKRGVKQSFELLLKGEHLRTPIEEQIVYSQLNGNAKSVWSLLLASGYLRVVSHQEYNEVPEEQMPEYELALTNREVRIMFREMVSGWFSEVEDDYNDFIRALLQGDVEGMNVYMNQVALATFSSFDAGKKPSEEKQPERFYNRIEETILLSKFYHGFVLGLMVELRGKYAISSNQESGYGRYDVVLEPIGGENAVILEFKVFDSGKEKSLEDTVQAALKQIEEKRYEANLLQKGIPKNRIKKYGFAFEGKKVLIGQAQMEA